MALVDVKPYANGYKATFNFGNPLSLDVEGAEIELRWGPERPKDFKTIKFSDWMKQFKTSKQSVTKRLRSGAWNPVEVVLAPATANEIGQIEVTSISTNGLYGSIMFLRGPLKPSRFSG